MDIEYKTHDKIEMLKQMVLSKEAGSPKQIATELNCCERTVKRMIRYLKKTGLNITFCRKTKKYYVQ